MELTISLFHRRILDQLLNVLLMVLIPFLDRYKKFSWRDRPMVTAFGITSLAQIMVTTYWGFYISPDVSIPLRYHSGTVTPGGTVGSNLNPKSIGNTPPVIKIAPPIAMTIGTSNTRNLGK